MCRSETERMQMAWRSAADLQLRADNEPFATGTGPLVTGPSLALVMSMAGRVSYLAELDGPGLPTLRSRLQATAA